MEGSHTAKIILLCVYSAQHKAEDVSRLHSCIAFSNKVVSGAHNPKGRSVKLAIPPVVDGTNKKTPYIIWNA